MFSLSSMLVLFSVKSPTPHPRYKTCKLPGLAWMQLFSERFALCYGEWSLKYTEISILTSYVNVALHKDFDWGTFYFLSSTVCVGVWWSFSSVHWNSTKSFEIGPKTTQDTKGTTKEFNFLLKIAANFSFKSDTFSPILSLIISPLRWWLHYKGQLGQRSFVTQCENNLNFKLFYIYFQIKACYRTENIETSIFPICLLRDEDKN